jgi:phosphatidylserine decarboxylase
MNSPLSVSRIDDFVRAFNLDTDELLLPLGAYPNFNAFFYRKLKPTARAIAAPLDDCVVVSPADCRLVAFPTLAEATSIWVKGQSFTVERLLGRENADVAPLFVGGAMVISRLAPQDYHRFHLAVTGRTGRRTPIDGALFTVNPIAIRQNVPDVYTENKREVCLVHTRAFGTVAIVAVGATVVGSINITSPDGAYLHKGDEHGYFAFGGSTVLTLFQPGTVIFDSDLVANSAKPLETLVRVGARIGIASGRVPDADGAAAVVPRAGVVGALSEDDPDVVADRQRAATSDAQAAAEAGGQAGGTA